MNWRREWKPLLAVLGVFALCYALPVGWARLDHAVLESLHLVRWYAREHVVLCLAPAFLIAGGIGAFLSQTTVMKYLGPAASKPVAYGVASVSGGVLAVCSCTVLPLFAGIHRMGAGLGPAVAFLYSGPAVNVLAIILTMRVLGPELGIARAVGAVGFSIVIGLSMQFLFRKEDAATQPMASAPPAEASDARAPWQAGLHVAAMVAVLVFANWGEPGTPSGAWHFMHANKWWLTSGAALGLGAMLGAWFGVAWWKLLSGAVLTGACALAAPGTPEVAFMAGTAALAWAALTGPRETQSWMAQSWDFAKQILPLLLAGVWVAGLLLGRPGHEGLIPHGWVAAMVGGNSLGANLFASVAGALMYFATLTEVPILQGLIGNGMGQGPALALLLAGPALSLPNMLVIHSVLGFKKTLTFVVLVIAASTVSGYLFGAAMAASS